MSALDAKPSTPDKNNALVRRLSTSLAVTVLLGLTLVFYHGLWLPGHVLIKRDAFRFFLPLKQYLAERLAAGELPQWFPYEGLGRPFIGVTHTAVFHPFTAFYFLLPVPDAYRVSTLLACLLAALGTFALGRVLGVSRAGALLAAIAFTLSGYVVSLTDNLLYLYSICLLPFFCVALDRALRERRAWAVAPAAIWATVFLNGDVQTGYYYGFIALLWTIARAPGPPLDAGVRLTLIAGLAALLAGVQLGPTWAAFVGSDRTQPMQFHEQALHWSTHPLRLVSMLASPIGDYTDLAAVARFFYATQDRPWGFWAESLYLGVPVMGLALLGAWHHRDLRVFILLGILALFLALGRSGGLYDVLYRVIPFWSAFRYPEKLMGIASFAVAMLAGAGLDSLRTGNGHPLPWLAVAILLTSAGLGLQTESAGAWAVAFFDAPGPLAHQVTRSAALACFFSAIAAMGMCLILAGLRKQRLPEAVPLAFLVTLVTLDLARANFQAYHTAPAEAVTFTPPFVEGIVSRVGPLTPGRFRLISIRDSHYVVPESVNRVFGHDAQAVERRQALGLEHNAEFHLESVYYYLSGLKTVLPQQLGIEAAARFNVAYYIGHRSHFQDPRFATQLVAALPEYDLALFQNPVPATPRAYLARQPERTVQPIEPAVLVARSDFLNGEVDVIEASDESLPPPAAAGSATIEQYLPETVRVRVEAPRSAVLILLDAFDQGWTAKLESGMELRILRANALVRAVVVPSGTHAVTFRYETPLLKAGATLSLAGSLICLGLIAHVRRRARPNFFPP